MYGVSEIRSEAHEKGLPNYYFTEKSIQQNLPTARTADAHVLCYFRNSGQQKQRNKHLVAFMVIVE